MTISKRISLLVGLLVLIVSASLGFISLTISTGIVEKHMLNTLTTEAKLGADLVSTTIHSELDTLQELANRTRTQSLVFETQKSSLTPDIKRLGYMAMAFVDMDGIAHYFNDDPTTNLSERAYMQKALKGEQEAAVVLSKTINQMVVIYVAPVYKNEYHNEVVGVLMVRKSIDTLSNITLSIGKYDSNMHAYLFDETGTFIAHDDDELVISQFNPIEAVKKDPSVRSMADAMQIMLSQKQGTVEYDYKGKKNTCVYTPVPGFSITLANAVDNSILMHDVNRLRNITIILVAGFLLIGIVIAILIARSISKPVNYVMGGLKALGEGDLTKKLEITSKDEMGKLEEYVNNTVDQIRNMALSINRQAGVLSDIGGQLASNMTETAAAINQVTANIQSIKGRVLNQSASVTETNATMEQITGNIAKLNSNIDRQTESVAQSSSAIEEMLANVESVTQTLIKNIDNVNNLAGASEVGRSGLQEVAANIQEIARESEGLLEINGVMENIASQTNLLSMNAAIEAAHAGEAGKGFAVVADEIRKLAESSSEQSKTISTVLKKIKESIDKISKSTDNVLLKFEAIDGGVRTVSQQEENIRNSMEEQGKGSQQILEAVARLNEITRQVKDGSAEMLEGSRQVITEGRNLEMATQEITNGMNEMATGADQINSAVNQVNNISGENRDNIAILSKEVSRFKIA
ncbi:methyl-accepting chemotaxis protein [Leadbettera azotonutricia]|uniref:Methyl-accepting chemotaxis protein n=1 Tax=Leadbettera azotonutricia (strain ATCC BAA-888 / DSM 13862 / ZAS-9) TaxID=545695 RepID=F5YBM8_LEAAZ|nr:methyl-accepting chemotaxis protein [Leadbettera azotonutricia]AEF82707.1 methyl-accepting chemotaxis protein [Leadbettera azotonutricia ZAS-9]